MRSRGNHPSPRCEENTACVQPDLIIPAYGILSGKLFHKTCLCGSLIGISDRNQGQEHYIAVLALTFWRLLFHCLRYSGHSDRTKTAGGGEVDYKSQEQTLLNNRNPRNLGLEMSQNGDGPGENKIQHIKTSPERYLGNLFLKFSHRNVKEAAT